MSSNTSPLSTCSNSRYSDAAKERTEDFRFGARSVGEDGEGRAKGKCGRDDAFARGEGRERLEAGARSIRRSTVCLIFLYLCFISD